MGIANSIIVLAFGSAVIGCALAAALAFGIGGRHAAGSVLAEKESTNETKHGIVPTGCRGTKLPDTSAASTIGME
ncbi:hypothetical protein GCM10027344_24680 [Spelaeicoccus albus]|uniref:Uncharacterized protein n=1 Tax=Spelaeicoccus albus TaxID=1280376 RepID=A0A7Z0II27_9MICO|nr:hypothetical protein [Spelaeicoccus albus]